MGSKQSVVGDINGEMTIDGEQIAVPDVGIKQ
jgi:hypothetical protein